MDSFFEVISTGQLVLLLIMIIGFIFVILYKGAAVSFKDMKIDTKHEAGGVQNLVIPVSHLIQFRKLRTDVKDDILVLKGELRAHFRSLFITYLKKDFLKGFESVSQNEVLLQYEWILQHGLDTVFDPMIKKVIFGNHFPVKQERESETEFEKRFFEKLTKPTTFTILKMTRSTIASNWLLPVNREEYERDFIMSSQNLKIVLGKASDLIIKCRERRDHVFQQIQFQDETEVEMIKFEWEMVYG